MSSSNPERRVAPASLRPLAGVREPLFVFAPQARVDQVAALCAEDMLGAIYTMPKTGNRLAALARTIQRHQAIAGPDATILADANHYSGKNRTHGRDGLDLTWVQNQLDVGLPWAITDSGFVDRGEEDDLIALFEAGYEIAQTTDGHVIINLPIEYTWLKERADTVRSLVDKYGIPFALTLGAAADPYATADVVRGFLHVISSKVPGAQLRTDMSGIGGVAAGGALAAIGVSSGTRHIYPAKGGGTGGEERISALLPQGLSYQRLDIMAAAAAQSPQEPYWGCGCEGCQGGRVDRHVFTDTQAFAHSIRGALEVARQTLRGATLNDNLKSFRSRVISAQFIHLDIKVDVPNWGEPKFLGAWAAATADLP